MEKLYVIKELGDCSCGAADAYLYYQAAFAWCLDNNRNPADIVTATWGEALSLSEANDRWGLTMLHSSRFEDPTVFIHGSLAERNYDQALNQDERDVPFFPKLRDAIKTEVEEDAGGCEII